MYKVLIADDESIIRNGLKKVIDWNGLGFEIAGEAADGEEALDIALEVKPDLLIVDINMPFMDGLAFIEKYQASHSAAKFIFLTGYQDFKYIQKALQLKASDYLIKPITPEVILEILARLKKELDAQSDSLKEAGRLEVIDKEILPSLRNRFFNEILAGKISGSEIERQAALLKLDPGTGYLWTQVYFLGQFQAESTNVVHLVRELAQQACEKGYVFHVRNDVICVVTCNETETRSMRGMIENLIVGRCRIIACGMGIPVKGWDAIGLSYMNALREIEQSFDVYEGGAENKPECRLEALDLDMEIEKLIITIKTGDAGMGLSKLEGMFDYIKRNKDLSLVQIKIHFMAVISAVIRETQKVGASSENVFGNGFEPVDSINGCRLMLEVYSVMKEFIMKACDYFKNKKGVKNLKTVERAIDYICENLGNPELDIRMVAEHVDMSPNYFGSIFKNETREFFTDFLTRMRIDKARKLLAETGLKVYEVALLSGFKEAYYFGVKFKAQEGITPLEYRDRYKIR